MVDENFIVIFIAKLVFVRPPVFQNVLKFKAKLLMKKVTDN